MKAFAWVVTVCALLALPASASLASDQCKAIPGAQALLSQASARYIIFGEIHGTVEAPAMFADFICMAASTPLTVGLEMDGSEQPRLDRYLRSNGDPAARAELLRGPHWKIKDGRASQAMLGLVESIRKLKRQGRDIAVVAFVREVPPAATQTPYEKEMAAAWIGNPDRSARSRSIILVGNIHALRGAFADFEPAAMHLPPGSSITVNLAPVGGLAFNCNSEGKEDCLARSMGKQRVDWPRSIRAVPPEMTPMLPYDYLMSPGGPFTPASPALETVKQR